LWFLFWTDIKRACYIDITWSDNAEMSQRKRISVQLPRRLPKRAIHRPGSAESVYPCLWRHGYTIYIVCI